MAQQLISKCELLIKAHTSSLSSEPIAPISHVSWIPPVCVGSFSIIWKHCNSYMLSSRPIFVLLVELTVDKATLMNFYGFMFSEMYFSLCQYVYINHIQYSLYSLKSLVT